VVGQRRERQFLAPHQRMIGRSQYGLRVGGKRRRHAVHVSRRTAHHHQVSFVARQQAEDILTVVDLELDVDTLELLAKTHQQHGDEVLCGADHGQVDAPPV
jgi:hypothetical protein